METRATTSGSAFLAGFAAGAGAAFLFDPDGGARRRNAARDWAGRHARQIGDSVARAEHDALHRASGALAEARGALLERGSVGPRLDVRSRRNGDPALQGRPRERHGVTPRTPAARLGTLAALGALAAYTLRGTALGPSLWRGNGETEGRSQPGRADRGMSRGAAARRTGQQVRDVMTPDPVCCAPSATAEDAARQMRDGHIGDVIVCEDGRLLGIVTDRDIVVRVVAEGRRPDDCLVREICSHDVVTVAPDDDADRAVELMKERAVRRLPVCGRDGRLVGVLSLGDLAVVRDRHSALGQISAAPAND